MDRNNSHFSFKLMNWNSCSLSSRKIEFYKFLKLNNINLATITETRLKPNMNFQLNGYKTYRLDRTTNSGGGVALLVDTKLEHTDVADLKLKIIEAKAVDIPTDQGTIRFISAYMPQNCKSPEDITNFKKDLKKLTKPSRMFVISGDLNAKHPDWNNHKSMTNKNGQILSQFKNDNSLTVIHPNDPTHVAAWGKHSTIDIIVTNIHQYFTNSITVNDLSSDHLPTISNLQIPFKTKVTKTRFAYNRANWTSFKNTIRNMLNNSLPLENNNDIDIAIEHFLNIVKTAENVAIPKITSSYNNMDVELDPETLEIIRRRNALRRTFQRIGDPRDFAELARLRKVISDRILHLKNSKFKNDLRSLPKNSKPFWKLTKILKNPSKPLPPFVSDGTMLLTNSEKCEALANHFQSSHNLTHSHKSKMETQVKNLNDSLKYSPNFVPRDHKITVNEIKNIVKNFKNFKAPGLDSIMSITIKRLPSEAYKFLTDIFNKCLELCYFPNTWKTAKIIPIVKPMKNATLASSYRPISLLSCVSKIFEKLLLERMNRHIFENNIYIEEQFGFRSGHSTTQQLQRVIQHIKKGRSQKKTTIMALLDIEKAFDSVWHDGLIYKLHFLNFPLYIVKTISSYLQDRKFQVFIFGTFSNPQNIPAGVPQGSVLGPVLYNIYTSDLPSPPPHCSRAVYADDTALMVQIVRGTKNNTGKLQTFIDQCTKYYEKWKIKPNSAKTEIIRFNGSKTNRKDSYYRKLKVNGLEIDWSPEVKYLGLTIDKKLTFTKHATNISQKAKSAQARLYPLLNRKSKLSSTNKLTIYRQIIRPIITYAAPCWLNIPKTYNQKLQVIQNKSIKMALNLHPRTRTTTLIEKSKIPLLIDYRRQLNTNFQARLENSPYEIIRDIGQLDQQ